MGIAMAQLTNYKPHKHGDTRRNAVIRLISAVVALDGDAHLQKVKKKLLDTLVWAYTEADGKHNTRHRSLAASRLVMPSLKLLKSALIHEHMTCKEHLVAELMRSTPADVPLVMHKAKACLVTREEHDRLTRGDRESKRINRQRTAHERYSEAEVDLEVDVDMIA